MIAELVALALAIPEDDPDPSPYVFASATAVALDDPVADPAPLPMDDEPLPKMKSAKTIGAASPWMLSTSRFAALLGRRRRARSRPSRY